ncbi:hypothetical protein J7I42_32040 [Niastella sp. MAH-29]|uniref:Uncharacterized protein n=2 Tax=Chitinophagaceae TaxID=563835 RepID=A0ABS3Z473_9BACT|nr:hypothetical protein [Niastella soli]
MLLLAVLCFGCGQTEKKAPTQKAPKPVHARNNAPLFQYGNPVLLQFDRYMAGLDTQSAEACHLAIDTFKLLFKKQPAAACDTAFYIYNQFHSLICAYLNEHMAEDSIKYEEFLWGDENGKMKPLSKRQKAVKNRLDRNGFELGSEEGEVFIEQSQHFLAEQFTAYVSAPMKQYLIQEAIEQKEGFQEDAGLTIKPTVFADRTVWWENFIKANPNSFIYSQKATSNYNAYLYWLMIGMDNTSVRSWGKENLAEDSLSEYFREAYSYLQEKHPQTNTNTIVAPYFNAWQKMDTTEITRVLNKFKEEHKSPWGE